MSLKRDMLIEAGVADKDAIDKRRIQSVQGR